MAAQYPYNLRICLISKPDHWVERAAPIPLSEGRRKLWNSKMGFYPNIRQARAKLKDSLETARTLRREIALTISSQQRENRETIRKSRELVDDSMRLLRELHKLGI
jgi:hypothetical protein